MVRIKHRYLLVSILYPKAQPATGFADTVGANGDVSWILRFRRPTSDAVDARVIARIVRDGVAELFGDYGSGMVGGSLKVVYFSPATSTTIIRVSRAHYRMVWAALSFATALPKPTNEPCVFQVLRVSGTIRKAEEEAMRRARLSIQVAKNNSTRSNSEFGFGASTEKSGREIEANSASEHDGHHDVMAGIEDFDESAEDSEHD